MTTGGSLVIAAPGGEKDTHYLARLCKEHDVSSCTFVPSQWDAMLRVSPTLQSYGCNVGVSFGVAGLIASQVLQEPDIKDCKALRTIICGGEVLQPQLVKLHKSLLPQARLFNDYGPTEVTVATTGRCMIQWCTCLPRSREQGV